MLFMQQRNTPKKNGIMQRVQVVSITIPAGQTSATATITAVNTANTRLHYRGQYCGADISTPNKVLARPS